MKNPTVALIQQACTADTSANIQKSAAAIRRAAEQGADLIILPELHTGLYFCQTEDVNAFDRAESIPGPSTRIFGALAKELNVVIIISLFERRAPGLCHNTAVVLERTGAIAGIYRKMHIPDDPGYYEKFYFTPGDLGFQPIQTSVGKLGVLVCWDQWYPEAARLMTLAGAELLIYPTAIGWDPNDDTAEQTRQRDAWVTIQRAHAVANGIPVVAVNRTGFEPSPLAGGAGVQFWGGSFAAGCQGELLGQVDAESETELLVQLSGERSETVRRIWPFLRDRRIDAYEGLSKRLID
ncbi:MAG: carbon-nitrogen hydrolase [Kiritimatiellae bacterium]|nr:carbon-nitrogen hydrolase [Kiritimatiellia bacterium]